MAISPSPSLLTFLGEKAGRLLNRSSSSSSPSLSLLLLELDLRVGVVAFVAELTATDFLCSLCRLSMSMTLSTVQKVPDRPQPAEQCTSIGLACSLDSGP